MTKKLNLLSIKVPEDKRPEDYEQMPLEQLYYRCRHEGMCIYEHICHENHSILDGNRYIHL